MTPTPWSIGDADSVFHDDDEVTEIVGANGETVLGIGWGGFACESDPGGAYPLLEASAEDWAMLLRAVNAHQTLVDACREVMSDVNRAHRNDVVWPNTIKMLEAALSKAAECRQKETP